MQFGSRVQTAAKAREIFLDALELPDASARAGYVAEACGDDTCLRSRVELMLRDHFTLDDFMAASAAVDLPSVESRDQAGTVIGRYKLLEKIGEGGMGVVYMAEQEEPVRRRVAVKVIKLGMDTRQVVARFEAERQALALMDHPNIARVFDGGATDSGRPYFVMELVQGVPITEFCDQVKLSAKERLKLFMQVCQAIQSAHQKGIIHRDIKPSNVLITMHHGEPMPKVIDFGIAKATNQKLTEKTLFTNFASLIGTPAYMSPEQAEMSSMDVDTRADIYSLGVLLYALLTGTTPFPEKRLRSVAYREMQRIIMEEEPERPSTRLTKTLAASVVTGRDSNSKLETRNSENDLDLDWIVMKCLEKDRARRYETASALAADIQRHLGNEPVIARPPSAGYRFRKLVRRKKLAFAAAATVLLTLLAGMATTIWQAAVARQERARAERRLQATVMLMSEAFENVVPNLTFTIGASQPRRDLAKAAVRIAEELLKDSEPGPEMCRVVGQLYLQLSLMQAHYVGMGSTTGEYAEGLEAARKAIHFFQPVQGEPFPEEQNKRLLWAEMAAGFAAQGLLQPEEAMKHFASMGRWAGLLRQSTNQFYHDRGEEEFLWSEWLSAQTLLSMDRTEEALTNVFLPQLESISKRAVRDEYGRGQWIEDMRDIHDSLGRCYLKLGQKERAETYFRQALAFATTLGEKFPNHSGYASYLTESQARLGEALLALNRPGEALPLLESALKLTHSLQQRDPGNPGFVQLEIKVLQSQASGYCGWAQDASAPATARAERLAQAGKFLDQARHLIASLKSESYRNFIHHDLRHVEELHERLLADFKLSPTASGGGRP